MNVLFVNYGDFTTNSLNHIGAFANELSAKGHSCIVAVPSGKETLRHIADPLFIPALYEELLERPNLFPNSQPADVIHAWTPREGVRTFVLRYQGCTSRPARLIVHLEDNEEHLVQTFTGLSLAELAALDEKSLNDRLRDGLSHPLRYRNFLRLADGVTVIVEPLRTFVPGGIPSHLLQPGLDLSTAAPSNATDALRNDLKLSPGEKVIVFTGSVTFANEAEMRELYVAVSLLNKRGVKTRLIRTGFNLPSFVQGLAFDCSFVSDLGFVEKAKLPALLALADVLVQPGRPGAFNDFRLPSKLPEFFAAGKPVVLPRSNIGLLAQEGEEALLLDNGSPDDIAEKCVRLFEDNTLAARLGAGARRLAETHFDLAANTRGLLEFYAQTLGRPSQSWTIPGRERVTEGTLLLERAARELADPAALEEARLQELSTTLSDLATQSFQRDIRPPDPHVSHLEATAERFSAEADLARRHITNLERLLQEKKRHLKLARDLSRQHTRNLEQNLETTRNALSASEGRLLLANRRAADLEVNARDRISELTERLERLKSDLRQKDQKVRRMQQTFSWQVTSPLRALRRLLVDPLKQKPGRAAVVPAASPPVASTGPTPDTVAPAPRRYSYTYNFDHPRSWSTSSNKLLILGWCFENEGAPIKGLRARFGDRIVEGIYGSKRLDVLASVGGKKQAEHCGIKLDIKTDLGDFPLYVEVLHEDGWSCYFETTVHVGKPGDPSELSEYEKWCQQHESLTPEDVRAIEMHVTRLARKPLISVVMPVYNPPEALFVKAIESVRSQLYTNWELCIADDCSTEPHVRVVIDRFVSQDKRIKVVHREKNGHISQASNSALELATGDYVALFDHDDVLAVTALYEVVAELNAHPDAQFIYTDEDKVDSEDRRFDPYFKPDWNPDLLHGQNYTSHLSVFWTDLVREVGGFRSGFEGSQDWDLTLRVIEKIPETAIRHIPKILYHWRAIPGSTALQLAEKSYPLDAAKRALTEHFQRQGKPIQLLTVPGDHWRIRYPLPEPAPLVSLIIPTRNAVKLVRQALTSILEKTTYPNLEILIVDNGSDDPDALAYFAAVQATRTRKDGQPVSIRVIPYPHPFNYSALNNFAVKSAAGTVVGLLNNDVEVINHDWLDELVIHAVRPGIGAVGAMLYYPMNTVQHAGVILGLGGVAGHPFKEFPRGDQGQKNRMRLVQNYSAVTAACLVIQKARFLEVGGLNEKNLAVAFNDVDFCCKLLKAGYRNVWTPFAELYHHESATRGIEDTPEKKARFQSEVDYMMATWPDLLANDPAYNPNLTLVGEDFAPAYLPRTRKPWQGLRTVAT